jgi:hypothetical protein
MKQYVEVFWAPWVDSIDPENSWTNTVYLPPAPLISLAHEKVRDAADDLFKCPAVKSLIKNDFVIKCPMDLNLTFAQETGSVFTDRYGSNFYEKYIVNRSVAGGSIIMTAPPRYVFFSKSDVEMMAMDLPIISSVSSKNLKLIPGKFNISKWVRPIEFNFTVIDPSQPVTLQAEDPLFALRFYTPDNVPVKMTRFEITQDIIRDVRSMVTIKRFRKFLPLEKSYELAEGVIGYLRKKF